MAAAERNKSRPWRRISTPMVTSSPSPGGSWTLLLHPPNRSCRRPRPNSSAATVFSGCARAWSIFLQYILCYATHAHNTRRRWRPRIQWTARIYYHTLMHTFYYSCLYSCVHYDVYSSIYYLLNMYPACYENSMSCVFYHGYG